MSATDKRAHGRYYTRGNPFNLDSFREWANKAGLPGECVLEPFAGANNIIKTLLGLKVCRDFKSYDLTPADKAVKTRNTVKNFPRGLRVCVTNPPWLARNSATRRGLPFPDSRYDDLYKHCLELCLDNCDYVAALVPASYLQSGLFQERLRTYILLHDTIFTDTENPVCLSLFGRESTKSVGIYDDETYIGTLASLRKRLPKQKQDKRARFNDPRGKLGFISFDNTREPSIRFCHASEVAAYPIKISSRFITRISGNFGDLDRLIRGLNRKVKQFRVDTKDVFLTPFKGIRNDGRYRRRMEFALARQFINAT